MRQETVTIDIYTFDELSEEAKERVVESFRDINVDYEWWEYLYQDAELIGLRIDSFDLHRRTITGELLESVGEIARRIIDNHGKQCDTYQLALDYYRCKHDKKYAYGEDGIKRALLQEYLSLLDKECDYLTSEEAIIETIKANDYEFTADGAMY